MKKFLALALALVMALSLVACGEKPAEPAPTPAPDDGVEEAAPLKVGFIFLHDENSTYDKNFMMGAEEAVKALGLSPDQYIFKTNIGEDQECYEAAAELADEGCQIVFANSFGHEDYMIQAAKEFPEVEFCHSTGTKAHTENLPNYHNAFASIYEGRYLAGVAAGLKLQEMGKTDAPKIGYVGAFTYAEVISGYSSFYLGVKSIVPSVTMEVTFTGSWYDETAEKEGAQKLIDNGCVLISQHADSWGAPTACENAGVPNVSYNGSTESACPNTFIVSSRINWAPYYQFAINAVKNGEAIPADYTGTIADGSVVLTELGAKAPAAGTAEKLEEVKAALADGSLQVYDTKTFTVGGAELTSYMADVDTDAAYEKDTEVVENGAFMESKYRSAPYFDAAIDGITMLDTAF